MVHLKHSDIRIIDDAFQSERGYCLKFSDRTFAEYFEDEFQISIDEPRYRANGTSKMNRLRTLFRVSDAALAVKVMRSLAEYREEVCRQPFKPETKERLFGLIARIEGGSEIARTDALERFTHDQTLDELIGSIERDITLISPPQHSIVCILIARRNLATCWTSGGSLGSATNRSTVAGKVRQGGQPGKSAPRNDATDLEKFDRRVRQV